MQKTVSLNKLHQTYMASGMTISELSEYLNVSVELIQEWESFFNLFPHLGDNLDKVYSKKRVKDFIKIKDLYDKGTPLHEIKNNLFRVSKEELSTPVETNPFEESEKVVDIKPEVDLLSPNSNLSEENFVKPFLTQLNKANSRIEELILEKANIIENTALEKADLISEINILKEKNSELVSEKESLFLTITAKEEQIKMSAIQEKTFAEALKLSQEMLRKKEDELEQVKVKIETYEKELAEKDSIIHNQSQEINKLLEKQNKKWWQALCDLFF